MITNMPMKSITKLAKMQLKDNASWTLTSNSLTGTGSYDYTYTYPYQELYVTVPDEKSISEAKEMISKVTSGEKLESSYDGDSSDVHSVTKSSVSKSFSNSSSSSSTTKTPTKKSSSSTTTTKKSNSSTNNSTPNNSSGNSNNGNTTTTTPPDNSSESKDDSEKNTDIEEPEESGPTLPDSSGTSEEAPTE